jgi:inorganic pyrophosphatase
MWESKVAKIGAVEVFNLWPDIPCGLEPAHKVYVTIEVPNGTISEYEFDCEVGFFRLDRVLYSAPYYFGDYGVIPRLWELDPDPLDILVLATKSSFTGCDDSLSDWRPRDGR